MDHENAGDEQRRDDPDDSSRERYRELLEELRTIMPGAQVLLGFLLTVPFAGRFAEVDGLGRAVYLVALVAVAMATVFFLAPTAYHRVAQDEDRQRRITYGVHMQLAGLVLVALGISAGLFVVVRFVIDWRLAIAVSVGIAALCTFAWLLRPAAERQEDAHGQR
ncbi:MAG: DUF6328 family protein [Aeromicrobium sp.]